MSSRTLKILFVGDAPGLLRIRELLAKTDFHQFDLEAVTPEKPTLKSFWRNLYDVCLVDGPDGIDLITESKRVGFTVPIIMMTSDSASEVLDAFRAGALDCLVRDEPNAAKLEESICWVIERARNLDSLAQHQRCYLGLVENTSDIIFTHDLKGNYTFINKAGEEATGYTRDEFVSLNLSQVVVADNLTAVWRTILRMLNDHQRAAYSAIIFTKLRKRLPLLVNTHLLYRDGIPVGVQAIAKAVSLQEHEDRSIEFANVS